MLIVVLLQCGKENPANSVPPVQAPLQLDKEIAGTWRYAMAYNVDTTIHIVMTYDSGYVYKISVDINNIDTEERENGSWFIVPDTAAKADTVWMVRDNCHQINAQTDSLDSINCGVVDTAGIKLNISQSGSKYAWTIPLNDFSEFLPAGMVPPGVTLPTAQFVRD